MSMSMSMTAAPQLRSNGSASFAAPRRAAAARAPLRVSAAVKVGDVVRHFAPRVDQIRCTALRQRDPARRVPSGVFPLTLLPTPRSPGAGFHAQGSGTSVVVL
jgi:hypothetical protein